MGDYREEPWQQELRENVQRGIEFLDEESPRWYTLIDPENLQMQDMTTCVCGHVFASMALGSGFVYFSENYSLNATKHGFDCPEETDDQRIQLEYSYLAELWIEAANKKLANEGMVW